MQFQLRLAAEKKSYFLLSYGWRKVWNSLLVFCLKK